MLTALVASVLVVGSLAACGGDSNSATTSPGGDGDGPQSFEDLEFRSPIAEFLGFDFGAAEDQQARFEEIEREAGRLTAQCMQNLGFDYTPPDNSRFTSFGSADDLAYFSDEWIEKYGFGITTQRFPQSMVGDLVGYVDERLGSAEADYVDPNQAYVESLSDSEREAYQEALWGVSPEFGPEGPTEEEMEAFEPTGCQNEAFEQAYDEGAGSEGIEAFYDAFGDDLQALEQRILADPRVVAFNDEVTDCVAAEGMEYHGQEDLYNRFEERLRRLEPRAFESEDPIADAGLDPEQMSDQEIQDFFDELNRLDDAGLALLAELQAEELELARVVVGCGGGPLQEQVALSDVRVEYEQDFLDRNADAIAEYAPD